MATDWVALLSASDAAPSASPCDLLADARRVARLSGSLSGPFDEQGLGVRRRAVGERQGVGRAGRGAARVMRKSFGPTLTTWAFAPAPAALILDATLVRASVARSGSSCRSDKRPGYAQSRAAAGQLPDTTFCACAVCSTVSEWSPTDAPATLLTEATVVFEAGRGRWNVREVSAVAADCTEASLMLKSCQEVSLSL